MGKLYAGLDTGSKTCYWWGTDREGNLHDEDRIPAREDAITDLFETLSSEHDVHVHLEATTYAGHLRYVIKPIVEEVIASDPRHNAHVSNNPHKCDREDAKHLSELLRTGVYNEVWYPDEVDRWVFRQLVLHYDMLDKETTGMKSRTHARYLMNGVFRRGNIWDPDRKAELLSRIDYPEIPSVLEQLYRCTDFLETQKEKASERMWDFAQKFPETEWFVSMPGVGPVIASRFSAYIGDPHRFPSREEVRSYSKMGIGTQKSEKRPITYEALDQSGRGALKDASYLAFISSRGSGNVIDRKYKKSLNKTGDKTHARLNTQRKVLDCLWSLWRKQETFDSERFLRN